jgi:SAM-dependent methyltransferase
MEAQYSGVDILTALESADHYNEYLTRLVRDAASGKELVDFGAGVGTFAKRLRRDGYDVVCIEPDLGQRRTLIEAGFEALPDLDSLPDDSAPFIFSLNVMEHIEDHALTLKQIRRKLGPGGTLLLYVPAFDCLWSSLDDKVCHHRRYTKVSLRKLVQQGGFAITELRYADSLGFLAALVFRLLRRSAATFTPGSIRFYDRWLFPSSRLLDTVLHPFFGKNVYVVCRKHEDN